MKVLTSFIVLNTGEGERISFTYSEVAEDGTIVSQNNTKLKSTSKIRTSQSRRTKMKQEIEELHIKRKGE